MPAHTDTRTSSDAAGADQTGGEWSTWLATGANDGTGLTATILAGVFVGLWSGVKAIGRGLAKGTTALAHRARSSTPENAA